MTPEEVAERIAADRRYNRKLWIGIAVFVFCAVIAAGALWSHNTNQRWEQLKADYEAAGETLDVEEFEPPPVRNEDNVFAIPELLEPEKYPTANLQGWLSDEITSSNDEPWQVSLELSDTLDRNNLDVWYDQWRKDDTFNLPINPPDRIQALLVRLNHEMPLIEKLRSRHNLPAAAWPQLWLVSWRYPKGALFTLNDLIGAIEARGLCELAGRRGTDFEKTLHLLLRASEATFAGGARRRISPAIFDLIYEAIYSGTYRPVELTETLKDRAEIDVVDGLKHTTRRLIASHVTSLDDLKSGNTSGLITRRHIDPLLPRAVYSWSNVEVMKDLYCNNPVFRPKSQSDEHILTWARSNKQRFERWYQYDTLMPSMILLRYLNVDITLDDTVAAIVSQTKLNMTKLAIAAELHKCTQGHYPATLREIDRPILPEIPLDLADGKPLRYALDGKRYKIWSVGPDGVDDGGVRDPNPKNQRWDSLNAHGDWVWAYPAP